MNRIVLVYDRVQIVDVLPQIVHSDGRAEGRGARTIICVEGRLPEDLHAVARDGRDILWDAAHHLVGGIVLESENELLGKNAVITCPKCGSNQFKMQKDKTRKLDIGRIGGKFVYEPILSCMKCGYSFHERELEGYDNQFFITP